jgi:hypothetical protein
MKSDELYESRLDHSQTAYYTHDIQSEDTTYLGMGIVSDRSTFLKTSETTDQGQGIIETYCVHLKADEKATYKYRFYAVWEMEDSMWRDKDAFNAFLQEEMKKTDAAVQVKIH